MPHLVTLTIGIASVGATVGYMVGASATPVVSIAVPAVFGLVITAIGLMQGSMPSKDYLEFLKSTGDQADKIPEVAQYRQRSEAAPLRIGLSLILFCISYLGAATLGAKVRIDNLLIAPAVAHPFPWEKSKVKPPTINAALEWIALQSKLRQLGYSDQNIQELFDIQVLDWKTAEVKPTTEIPRTNIKTPTATGIDDRPQLSQEDIFKQWELNPGKDPAKPFANQPPKELREKLKDVPAGPELMRG